MMHKALSRLVLPAIAGLCVGAQASPLFTLGNNINVFFNGSASVRFVDNVFYDESNEESDTIFVFSPGVELVVGDSATPSTISFFFREDFQVYSDNDDLNEENAYFNAQARYATGNVDVKGNFVWYETDQPDPRSRSSLIAPGQLIRREITDFKTSLRYNWSPKIYTIVGFGYFQQHYLDSNIGTFSDHEAVQFPFDVLFAATPTIDVGVGYRYRQTDSDLGGDRDDHFYYATMRGELLPKLSGDIRVGGVERKFDAPGADNRSTLFVETELNWIATPKLQFGVSGERMFGTGGAGESFESTSGRLSASYAFTPFIGTQAYIDVEETDYAGTRKDDTTYTGISVYYTPNDYLRFSTGYTYQENDSNFAGLSYQANVINFTASLRY